MSKLILFGFIFILLISQVYSDSNNIISFPSLTEDEELTFEKRFDENVGARILSIFKKGESKDLLFEIRGFEYNPQYLVNNNKIFYYLKEVGSPDGSFQLWVCDGEKGQLYKLMKMNPSFVISDDGRLLCFDDNTGFISENVETDLYPYLVLYDLSSSKIIQEYDFGETFLKKYPYSWAEIRYSNDLNRFDIELGVEGVTITNGYIAFPDFEFIKIEESK